MTALETLFLFFMALPFIAIDCLYFIMEACLLQERLYATMEKRLNCGVWGNR
jgi:hypothetical protein